MSESSLRFGSSCFVCLLVLFPFRFYSWTRNTALLQKNFVSENWDIGYLRLNIAFPCLLAGKFSQFQGRKY